MIPCVFSSVANHKLEDHSERCNIERVHADERPGPGLGQCMAVDAGLVENE